MNLKEVAIQFGNTLDQDDFHATKKLLSSDCIYQIGSEILEGPIEICNSYEQNMIEGRKKLDELVWGKSKVEVINENEFYVHFTDHLTHQGKNYIHKCKQKLTIRNDGLISKINHIEDPSETKKLKAFYKEVGILKN